MTTRRCAMCGRTLTVPSRDGYGPTCRRKTQPHPPAATSGPVPGRAPTPTPGQLAIPVQLALPEPRTPYHPPVWRGRPVQTITTGGLT